MKTLMIGSAMSIALLGARYMNEIGEGGEGSASTKTTIRPNLEGYQTSKSASGSTSKICGDAVSLALVGATLDETYGFVAKVVSIDESVLRAKYGARNVGQQRMFLGNLIRGAIAGKDTEKAARIQAAFDASVPELRKVVDIRVAADVAAAAKIKADKKTAAEQAKVDAKAKKDQAAADKKANAQLAADSKAAVKPAAPKAPTAVKPAAE